MLISIVKVPRYVLVIVADHATGVSGELQGAPTKGTVLVGYPEQAVVVDLTVGTPSGADSPVLAAALGW